MKIAFNKELNIEYYEYDEKILLSDVFDNAGYPLAKPCGSNGKCGKCKVKVHGKLSPITANERATLTIEEINGGVRLACQTYAIGDVEVSLLENNKSLECVTAGKMPEFVVDPITDDLDGYAVAIDIGTTTVACYLYKLPEGICVSTASSANLQASFGADVISRIDYAIKWGGEKLKESIVKTINELIASLGKKIDIMVITGNTVMLHLFTGLDPSGIAVAPFTPLSLFGVWQGNTYLAPCISAYVGADIVTAILASDMQKDEISVLIDIGTNGEMALVKHGKLIVCATAAGPAFEGAMITNGMLAKSGAINKVFYDNGTKYTTINGAAPCGICGTGLIDAVATMLNMGVLDETGYIEEDFVIGDSGIVITAADIRQVQLAKSAIRAGLETLLIEENISYDEVQFLYIAGGFGNFIDKNSATRIGLIPNELLHKVKIIGNAAGMGACMVLLSKDMQERALKISKDAVTIELSSSSVFMDNYIENMMFVK